MSNKIKRDNVEELARELISWHWQHKGYNPPKHIDWHSLIKSEDMVLDVAMETLMEWSDEDLDRTRENVFTNYPNITLLKKFSKDLQIIELEIWNSFKENDNPDINYSLGW
jgi:hypothetical protein|tara:strand:+ start:1476 stop:1808 length:333 start_codon:yes stop_codon:yes gene_type:complete